MKTERLDEVLDRLDELLGEIDDPDLRKDVREIQQFVIGAREDWEADLEAGPETGTDGNREQGPADED